MMTTATPQNYSPEMTKQIVEAYKSGQTVEQIAAQTGKSTRSIVAKLSREGVYQAKTKAKGTQTVRKAELITQIAYAIGTSEELIESLEKATKEALELIAQAVRA
jgi:transposase-like protein